MAWLLSKAADTLKKAQARAPHECTVTLPPSAISLRIVLLWLYVCLRWQYASDPEQEKVDQLQDSEFVQKFAEAAMSSLLTCGETVRLCIPTACVVAAQVDFVQKARDAANQARSR